MCFVQQYNITTLAAAAVQLSLHNQLPCIMKKKLSNSLTIYLSSSLLHKKINFVKLNHIDLFTNRILLIGLCDTVVNITKYVDQRCTVYFLKKTT